MSDARQRIAHARECMQGQTTGASGGVEAVLGSVLDALDALNTAVEAMHRDLDRLEAYVQAVDDDLFDVESDLYGYDDGEMTELECPQCHTPLVVEEAYLDDDASEVTCPECGHILHRGPHYQADGAPVAGSSASDGKPT